MIHDAANSSPIRMIMARERPRLRALACCSTGSLLAKIEMKMTLSTPRTTSSTNRVRKATNNSGLKSRVNSTREG